VYVPLIYKPIAKWLLLIEVTKMSINFSMCSLNLSARFHSRNMSISVDVSLLPKNTYLRHMVCLSDLFYSKMLAMVSHECCVERLSLSSLLFFAMDDLVKTYTALNDAKLATRGCECHENNLTSWKMVSLRFETVEKWIVTRLWCLLFYLAKKSTRYRKPEL
jgi:hypothetical protein